MIKAKIIVKLKNTILDPQGKTIQHALETLGYKEIESLRSGKFFEINLNMDSEEKAKSIVDEICRKILSNPVTEEYQFTVEKITKL
ncbi:phosphoribosylformylglycinamidine synthase [Candidatus Kryptonium thompsonii]|jgi:phosphoribosylformylglycinamidine synthase|uniref:Phosphoribosylformylglycinamidine synthase subunit PurS n=1 Tax=Candidatus Kryptonium thompsonii TaxID=1633631 RepID=A0A0N7MSD1_9BACT|nr:phosphoribosylformylglycinamidine synthase subunit PurS [Candidatus Kryptonium thompsoni]CUS78290.1 phosphoribosylformylglycinamidine synthase [Candidatus Kryptonium thompsoni]CUS81138.1 phosphoribosylformylglycinamidine synthase [Candidatus Kryptonium thompsoni]CUS86669.1 phosphoribosylformylglycinamidine synthase [Candidatus Kryptonium thompsoni]CUS87107.1 phosphoribosylformylglycinamidine synthase [Candidatus Kryptonium thompsoni]CUS89467.1 phosphoribosylformylglycinamidine synthase [Can